AEQAVRETDAGMLADPVGKKLLACLEPFSAKKKIAPDDNLELDLGLDSLARVELVVSIEKSFGVSLPESFGSEVFTVKDAVMKIKGLLAAGPAEAGGHVRLSWGEILSLDPAEEAKDTVRLGFGPLCQAGRYLLRLALSVTVRAYGRLSVTGVGNLPPKGPYIMAPNHLSLADAPAVMAALPWRTASQVFSLGATGYFGGPVMSRLSKFINVIPVDMDSRLHNALQLSAYVLRRGKVLLVFPEGGRSRDGSLKEFKKGVGIIARELNIPIIPVVLRGTDAMLAPGMRFPRPAKISVSFGKPVYPEGRDYEGIVQALYGEVVKMLEAKQAR
ncbi:MAG TPA: 1-acyl-sn-glycerol-3-phosphate acyltransferase, partial [Nitrospirota bacterium]